MWVDIDKEGQIYLYSEHDNYMYLDNKDFVSGKRLISGEGPKECVVVPLEEYQRISGELLAYKIKEMGNPEVSNIVMID